MAIDVRQLDRFDQGVLATGVLAFIFSLFNIYYGASFHAFGVNASETVNAWFFGWNVFAMLLVIAATLLAAGQIFARESLPSTPVGYNFLVAALSALGTLILIIRSFTTPSASGDGGSVGLRWGAYILMLLCIAQVVFAVLRLRQSGEPLPWAQSSSHRDVTDPPAA